MRPHSTSLFRTTYFFFNDTATTEIYTLSLHDALPICVRRPTRMGSVRRTRRAPWTSATVVFVDMFASEAKSAEAEVLTPTTQLRSLCIFRLEIGRAHV